MCLIHDLGECFTGDIPTFLKKESDEIKETNLYANFIETLPEATKQRFKDLYDEMEAMATKEAKTYKALDKLEAVIAHNLADINTWLPLEYDLQLNHGKKEVEFSDYFKDLKKAIDQWTKNKIATERAE